MFEILIYILVGLIAGDTLCFVIYCLSKCFAEDKKGGNRKKTGIFREYIDYVLSELKQRRARFIIYYIFLDIVTVSFTVLCFIKFGVTLQLGMALIFCYSLIVLTFIDAKTQFLPDLITKPLFFGGLLQGYLGLFTDLWEAIFGATVGYLVLWTINYVFRLVKNKDGMGGGDFKLFAAIGAWVGLAQLPLVILISSFAGIFIALIISLFPNKKLEHPTPFGPSLAVAGAISLFWGSDIVDWYLSLVIYQW